MTDGEAQAAADAWGWQVMPLYLAPRLTDEEREAVDAAATFADNDGWLMKEQIATLRGLLERMSENGDCLALDNATIRDNSDSPQPIAKCESDSPQAIADARLAALQQLAELDEELGLPCTPNPHATPRKCTVPPEWTSRPYYVDPPSGHRYGFPRLYDPAADGDMTAWMIRHGYPERLARQDLPCTFTACTEDGGK